jgi:hypothetical protein
VLSVLFVGTFWLGRAPKKLRDLIYGADVKISSLSIITTFFGVSQTKLPVRNRYGRFIVAMLIFFCLIFRTAYQGVLYELITTTVRRPPPKTFQDLVDNSFNGYTLWPLSYIHLMGHTDMING